jgi:hypothetical protein
MALLLPAATQAVGGFALAGCALTASPFDHLPRWLLAGAGVTLAALAAASIHIVWNPPLYASCMPRPRSWQPQSLWVTLVWWLEGVVLVGVVLGLASCAAGFDWLDAVMPTRRQTRFIVLFWLAAAQAVRVCVHWYVLHRYGQAGAGAAELVPSAARGPQTDAGPQAAAEVPIERRAMSLAALRRFTDQHVAGNRTLAREASVAAVEFLQQRERELRRELEEVGGVREAARSLGGIGQSAAQQVDAAEMERLQQSWALVHADLAKRRAAEYLTTRDVHKLIIKPRTDELRCRWADLPEWAGGQEQGDGRPFLGAADYFVSHSWDTPWEELVGALEQHAADTARPNLYFWVDIFAVCQHWATTADTVGSPGYTLEPCTAACVGCTRAGADMHDWASVEPAPESGLAPNPSNPSKGFERVIQHAGKTLVVMEPYDNPRPPTRVWCLFEMYSTLNLPGGEVVVALSRGQRLSMQRGLKAGRVNEVLAHIDAENACATVEADRAQIFSAIRGLG